MKKIIEKHISPYPQGHPPLTSRYRHYRYKQSLLLLLLLL